MRKLLEWIAEEYEEHERELAECSQDGDYDSYGRGYEAGFISALCEVRTRIENPTVFPHLLASLIQMESWASLYQGHITLFYEQSDHQGLIKNHDSRCFREIKEARAVMVKAKELDQ